MSFGDKHIDSSYDQWVTQTPEEYFGYEEEMEEDKMDEQQRIKEALEERNQKTKVDKWKESISMSRQQKYGEILNELGIDKVI